MKEMQKLIEKEVALEKESLIEEGVQFTEEDVRLTVYEDLRDILKLLMSDVIYKNEPFTKELFDKMSYDVSNGFGRKKLKDYYGEENVKLYLEYGNKKDLFEGELEG